MYQAEVKATLDFSTSDSSVFIIATHDHVIREIAQEIVLPDEAILVHTSGSQPLDVLQFAATQNLGVFYPLQTFIKSGKVDFKTTPVFIESSNEETGHVLLQIAGAISDIVKKIGSEERKALHVAAVFASNFTNHMLTISNDILQQNSLEFDWLVPLITQTFTKSLSVGPGNSQTGPAKRGDLEILENHLEFLQENQAVAEIYKVISKHIIDTYGSE